VLWAGWREGIGKEGRAWEEEEKDALGRGGKFKLG